MQKTKKLFPVGITAIVVVLMAAMMVLAAGTARAGVISVDVNDLSCVSSTDQPNPYSVVYCSIQDAINDASNGDIIEVDPGTYYENINFWGKAITVKSTDPDPANTIIDGSTTGTGTAVTFHNGEGSSSVLDGFTISGWIYGIYNVSYSSPTIINNTITGSTYGIYNFTYSSPRITNNIITGNGTGIHNNNSSPTITNNTITATGQNGSGIYNSNSSNSTITNNTITATGQNGSGIYNVGSSPSITNNTITSNSKDGIYNSNSSDSTITNNTIIGGAFGIRNFKSSPTITNNTIRENTYGIYNKYEDSSPIITNNTITGGEYGIYNYFYSSPTITNNTITGNNDSGIYNYYYSSPTITNNIITGGDYGIYNEEESSPTITYNDLWGNATNISSDTYSYPTVKDNINADPMFVNAAIGDYHLETGSPCIDAGTNDAPDLAGTDFDVNPRVVDGDGDEVAVVDMGAFEFEYQGTGEEFMDMECFAVNYMKVINKKKRDAKRDKIKIRGSFKLDEDAAPFDPLNDNVTLTIYDSDGVNELITITIPHKSFKQKKHSLWRFKGDIKGVRVHMHLNFDKCRWWIKIRGKDTSVLVRSSSLTVKLNIGMNTGDAFGWTKKRDRRRIGFAKFIERPRIRCCR